MRISTSLTRQCTLIALCLLSVPAFAGIEFFCMRLSTSGDEIRTEEHSPIFGRLSQQGGLMHVFQAEVLGSSNMSNLVRLGTAMKDNYVARHESYNTPDRHGELSVRIPRGVWSARQSAHFTLSLDYVNGISSFRPATIDFACEIRRTDLSERDITDFHREEYEFYSVCDEASSERRHAQCRIGRQ